MGTAQALRRRGIGIGLTLLLAATATVTPARSEVTPGRILDIRRLDADNHDPLWGRDIPGLAVNPADPRHVVLIDEDFLSGQCVFHTSFDGGRTWPHNGHLTVPSDFADPPCRTFDSGGDHRAATRAAHDRGPDDNLDGAHTDDGGDAYVRSCHHDHDHRHFDRHAQRCDPADGGEPGGAGAGGGRRPRPAQQRGEVEVGPRVRRSGGREPRLPGGQASAENRVRDLGLSAVVDKIVLAQTTSSSSVPWVVFVVSGLLAVAGLVLILLARSKRGTGMPAGGAAKRSAPQEGAQR